MKIATRVLGLHGSPDGDKVTIDIFAPETDGESWTCRYEIHWPNKTWKSFGAGFDSVQALVTALQKIGTEIYFSEYHTSGKLFWDRPGNGYGFPVPPNARDVLTGDDVKYL